MSKTIKNSYAKSYKIVVDNNESFDESNNMPGTSKPLHVQRVEKAVDLSYFLQPSSSSEDSSDSDESDGNSSAHDATSEALLAESEPLCARDFYNFKTVSANRKWLADILQENSDATPEDAQYKLITRFHSLQNRLRQTKKNLDNYVYYGSGLVSSVDRYPEIERNLPVKPIENHEEPRFLTPKHELSNDLNLENGIDFQDFEEDQLSSEMNLLGPSMLLQNNSGKRRVKRFRDEESKRRWEDIMANKRRKLFTSIVKKEIGKQHRQKINRHKEALIQTKRVAQQCVKYGRQKALQSARTVKEQQWRMKRLSRENIAYWKRSRRFDREVKKRLEKEAEEQRKIDHEMVEAKRQQRKLNFLITQTELYAHFMSKKLGTASPEEQLRILSQLDEDASTKLAIDDYNSDLMKEKAKKNALDAFQSEKARTRHFDAQANSSMDGDIGSIENEQPQPDIFRGQLKGYQLRGMNWLANLYSQGISGILADEMGLGKTVQSIAFLCHIAEKYSVWGPFLIISPASTLHNWQQEIAKFVPDFKVVPYWGNPHERKILRQFWDQKDIYTKDASFHIVVTSYQIVITDIKYFNRIKWQYMILDEAQAIKSTSSMRWKTLLGFSCRNRLLLSGTPIQNSMAELWALLHFIMPTLFDSHEEFNEWFSKDIESHAENKTGIDEKHLSRLHMILKPFMLRRIKKDVENELSDKIEVMVYCPLTTRQNLLYVALKRKIKIEDLLHYSVGGGDSHTVDKNFTSNLMNLVMQFRKVCNHPELFERRDAKSPIRLLPLHYSIPYLVYDYNLRNLMYITLNKCFTFTAKYISDSVQNNFKNTIFNFCYALKLSFSDLYRIFNGDILQRWINYFSTEKQDYLEYHRKLWHPELYKKPTLRLSSGFKLGQPEIENSIVLQDLVFARYNRGDRVVYTHTDHCFHVMQETVEHKNIRLKTHIVKIEDDSVIDIISENVNNNESNVEIVEDFTIRPDYPSKITENEKTELPSFLFCQMSKVSTANINLYCYSRRAAWHLIRHIDDYSFNSLNYYWSQATDNNMNYKPAQFIHPLPENAVDIIRPVSGWSSIAIPDKESLVTDSGKLSVLDSLLKRLKEGGHRVLIYSQMTKMIDLLEEYMWHRHHKYMRLDGSSKISERRDMVADFQARTDIFVFLLSTRAGGLGINLTAADTVIFYDSDWNPTVDQQAMDRAHRLGQTKQVTVYRLICKGSIEERILQRAREKSEIQKLVISGGNFKPDTLKPKEVVSLLLDDDELVQKYHLRVENTVEEEIRDDRKRKHAASFKTIPVVQETKRIKQEIMTPDDDQWIFDSVPSSPKSVHSPDPLQDDLNESGCYTEEMIDSPVSNKYTVYNVYGSTVKPRMVGRGSSRRGRPRGSRSRVSSLGRYNTSSTVNTSGLGSNDSSFENCSQNSSSSSIAEGPVGSSNFLAASPNSTIRRGPGRPRLKPGGPPNAGSRGSYRPRKPAKPLPVPLPADGSNASNSQNNCGTSYNTYLYDFPEHSDS